MELDGMSDIEGKTAREAASEFQSIDKSFVTIHHQPLTMRERFAVVAGVSPADAVAAVDDCGRFACYRIDVSNPDHRFKCPVAEKRSRTIAVNRFS